jgi:hypothetical protein
MRMEWAGPVAAEVRSEGYRCGSGVKRVFLSQDPAPGRPPAAVC